MTSLDQDPGTAPRLSHRLPFMLLVVILLTFGLWAGFHHPGWDFAAANEHIANQHGPLMVSGFIASVIGLERAVALMIFDRQSRGLFKRSIGWLIPIFNIAGSFLLLWPDSAEVGRWVIAAASLGLLAIMLRILDLAPSLHTLLMAFGAGGWAYGNLLWLGGIRFSTLLPAWAMFVIFTFTAARFELDRIPRVGRWVLTVFYTGGFFLIAGALMAPLNSNLAVRCSGLGALIMSLWLLTYDVARRRLHLSGLSRFIALAVLTSFVWLGVYGVLALRFGFIFESSIYDAVLHSLTIGFACGFIAGQAPVNMPALLGFRASYRDWLAAPVIGLHLSLAVRVLGDLADWTIGWQWAGLFIAAFGLLYVALLLLILWLNRRAA